MTKDEQNKKKEGILQILERFPFYKYAAQINGISRETLENWRNADENFSSRCEASRAKGLMQYAGKANTEFMLAAAEPETFGRKDKVSLELSQPLVIVQANESTSQSLANSSVERPTQV